MLRLDGPRSLVAGVWGLVPWWLPACATPPTAGSPVVTVTAPNAVVVHVVDGDTVDVEVGGRTERVRLLGIDTPEIAHPPSPGRAGNAAECFADEAHRFTESVLAPGTPVRLERDVVGRDDYGRLLAHMTRAADGLHLNLELVRRGLATVLTIEPNVAHRESFVAAARAAEGTGAGLWSACA